MRKACVKVGINLAAHYRYQDPEKLGQVFHLVRLRSPLLPHLSNELIYLTGAEVISVPHDRSFST